MNASQLVIVWAIIATVLAAVSMWPDDAEPTPDGTDGGRERVENRADDVDPATKSVSEGDDPEMVALKRKVSDLETRLAAAGAAAKEDGRKIAALEKQLEPYLQQTRATIGDVSAMLDAMRKKGLTSLLEPGKVGRLVGDLRELGDEGMKLLLGLIDSEDPQDRMLAAKLLGDLADGRGIDALAKACEDENDRVASMASQALALMGDPNAKDHLRRLYDASEGKPGIRINTLFGLCKIGESKAIGEAQAFFASSEVPDAYKQAMGRGILLLDNPEVVPVVRTMSGLDKSSADLGNAVVRYLEKVHTNPHARTLLADIVADMAYPQSVRDLASSILAQ